ncbi:hypothetical protein CoNPh17_CDS0023 [Staphylococcus phage S-CoN_Ph17]|nr:hypothetical protein CoNPh17_CDS0023 [Staphylococcus phage S-CoN_Ph17]
MLLIRLSKAINIFAIRLLNSVLLFYYLTMPFNVSCYIALQYNFYFFILSTSNPYPFYQS